MNVLFYIVAFGGPIALVGVAGWCAYLVIRNDAHEWLLVRGWRKIGKRTYRKGGVICSQRKALRIERSA